MFHPQFRKLAATHARRIVFVFAAALAAVAVGPVGCGGGGSSTTSIVATIATQPAGQTVAVGQTATFTVVAAGTPPLTYQWQKNGAAISGATSASYTTPAVTSADNNAKFVVVVSNSAGSATSSAATLTVGSGSAPLAGDVTTYHYDAMRSGATTTETVLTPAAVNATKIGRAHV